MDDHVVLDIQISSGEGFNSSGLQALTREIQQHDNLVLAKTPTLQQAKNDSATIAMITVAIISSVVPILIQSITEWAKSQRLREIEVEVAHGDRKIRVHMTRGDDEEVMKIIEQIKKVL